MGFKHGPTEMPVSVPQPVSATRPPSLLAMGDDDTIDTLIDTPTFQPPASNDRKR